MKSDIYNIEQLFPGPVKVRATKTKQCLITYTHVVTSRQWEEDKGEEVGMNTLLDSRSS